jgi:uncharacterized protein involved in outer membrane biogenesis
MGSRRALLASLALLAFVVLGIVAVQGLPALLDWDARRPQLAAIAGERLGRPVSLDGPVTLTLLPQPRLEAAQVRIGGDGEGIGIATRALHLRLDLGALLLAASRCASCRWWVPRSACRGPPPISPPWRRRPG